MACAFAEPEADPQLLAINPFTYVNAHSQSANLVKHPSGAVTPDETASVKAAKLQHLSAKAYSWPYMSGYTMPYTYAAAAPYTYAAAAPINTFSPYISLAKREAEAEPEADPQLLYSNICGGLNYGLNYGLTPYMSSYMASAPLVKKTVVKPAAITTAKYVAAPAISYSAPLTYSSFPYTSTFAAPYTTLAHTIAKREAEPEADPQYFYGNYYAGYPYSSYYNRGYAYAAPYRYASSAYRYYY